MPTHLFPHRFVLDGVPRIAFYQGGKRCPEDLTLPAAMRAWLEFMGEQGYGCKHVQALRPGCPILCTYSFLAGVSGAASFLSWKEGWHGDNVALSYLSVDPTAPEREICDAIGYAWQTPIKEPGRDDEADWRRRIATSLQAGRPVIGYGIIGPPEPALIAGYDEGGDVLIGWSFFQDMPEFSAGVEFEPSGYFRKRNWHKDTERLLILGEKHGKPPLRETYRRALRWLLEVARTPMVRPGPDASECYRHRHNGLAAYEAWARQLAQDGFDIDEPALRARYGVHDGVVGMVAEARWYGSQFLAELASAADTLIHRDAVESLYHAAACYAGEHELMWQLWDLAGGLGNPEGYRKLAEPGVRQRMAEVIRQSAAKDAQAAAHIERALKSDAD